MRAAATSLALLFTACSLPAGAQSLAIVHARAWTGVGDAAIEDATILIEGDRIRSVTPGGAVPAGVRVIDAGGRPVTAGLVNAATQLGLVEVSSAPDTRDTTGPGNGNGAGFDVSRALNGNSALVALARADGLTRALSYPAPAKAALFSGLAATVRLREGADILDRPARAEFVTIGGTPGSEDGSRAARWQRLRAALDAGRAAASPGKAQKAADGDAAAVSLVLTRAIPLVIAAHRETDLREAIALTRDYGIRVVIVGGADAWRVADALAGARIAVIVDPQANLPESFDQLGARRDNAAILARAGVPVAFGNTGGRLVFNYNAGLALREGAGLAVASGMPYADALRAVTVNPLGIFGDGGGTLTPGAAADLVIWDGDPFEPSTNSVAVIIEGREQSIANRQTALVARYLAPAP
ncbi:amidohydrolase family protein [Sphingopyxis terrae]|uniref:amidohydrolase family protein n=1 Tax=Sphingopyxis terrae TaxID=33052 RepID=UPI003F8086F6